MFLIKLLIGGKGLHYFNSNLLVFISVEVSSTNPDYHTNYALVIYSIQFTVVDLSMFHTKFLATSLLVFLNILCTKNACCYAYPFALLMLIINSVGYALWI